MVQRISLTERLTIAVPAELRDAVRTGAERHGLTVADYVRAAISGRLTRDRIEHPRLPHLRPGGPKNATSPNEEAR